MVVSKLKTILIILLAFLVLIVTAPGPIWFFPLFLVVYLLREKISFLLKRFRSLPIKFFAIALLTGFFVELLAIINSLPLPPEQRALFHPDPLPDLIFAFGYYAFIALGAFFILKRYDFSLRKFFSFAGIYGVLTEQLGAVFAMVLSGNLLAGIYVFFSYGSFLALPYLVLEKDFAELKRKKTRITSYILSMLVLFFCFFLFALYFLVVQAVFGI